MRGRHVIHRIGREEKKRPTSSHASPRQNAIPVVPFEPDSCAQDDRADQVSHQHLAAWPKRPELPRKKKRDPYYQKTHAQLVEPVCSQPLFEVKKRAEAMRERDCGLRTAKSRWRRSRRWGWRRDWSAWRGRNRQPDRRDLLGRRFRHYQWLTWRGDGRNRCSFDLRRLHTRNRSPILSQLLDSVLESEDTFGELSPASLIFFALASPLAMASPEQDPRAQQHGNGDAT